MKFIIGILAMTFSILAQAQSDQAPQPAQKPSAFAKLVMREGAAYYVFADGREAAIFIATTPILSGQVGLKQIENTCLPQQKLAHCQLRFEMIPHEITMRWTKHPQKDKIGQILKILGEEQKQNRSPLFRYGQSPELQSVFQKDVITCDKFDWLDEIPATNGVTELENWTTEYMLPNSETGANENQGLSSQLGMKFQKIAVASAQVASYGRHLGPHLTIPAYVLGQVANVGYLSKSGEACQLAFALDYSELLKAGQESNVMTSLDNAPVQLLNYKINSSNLTSLRSPNLLLQVGFNGQVE